MSPKAAHTLIHQSRSSEWQTPSVYLEAARTLLGGIDLDPASCAEANQRVRAARYYTRADDGLSAPWYARVWLNPPYGTTARNQSQQKVWSQRLILEYTQGTVSEAVLLVNAQTGELWFQPLWAYPICFTRRLQFHRPGGSIGKGPTHGSAFVYFGPQVERFAALFGALPRVGRIVLPDGGVTDSRNTFCEQCGIPFPLARRDARYCSPACRQRAYRGRGR